MGRHQLLGGLSLEILLLIFEELYSVSPESFSSLRFTSHELNKITTPFIYRKVVLRTDIIEALSEPSFKDVVYMIRSHARHVVIKCLLDWDLVADLLLKCQRLDTVTWIYWKAKAWAHFPERLQGALKSLPHVSLCINNYTYPGNWGPYTADHTMSIPAANLVSFTAWSVCNVGNVEPLQDLLVASQRLETLTFMYMPNIFRPERGKLPPIRRLSLLSTMWPYPLEDVNKIWDFSRLEDLELPWHALGSFLESSSSKDLCRLKRLRVDESCWEPDWREWGELERYRETVTCQIQRLLEGRHEFEELDIRCLLSLFDVSLIAQQGSSLRALKLFDTASFMMEGLLQTVSLSGLRMLQTSCININSLDLAMNIIGDETTHFLDILSRFRNLRDLTLYIQTRLREDMVDILVEDIDHQSAMDLMESLVSIKSGVRFSKLSINVGGRKRDGSSLRRALVWDRGRKQGRNPERLFVFEWNHEGTLSFREHMNAWQRPWPGKE